jgi:hypothetical protein
MLGAQFGAMAAILLILVRGPAVPDTGDVVDDAPADARLSRAVLGGRPVQPCLRCSEHGGGDQSPRDASREVGPEENRRETRPQGRLGLTRVAMPQAGHRHANGHRRERDHGRGLLLGQHPPPALNLQLFDVRGRILAQRGDRHTAIIAYDSPQLFQIGDVLRTLPTVPGARLRRP